MSGEIEYEFDSLRIGGLTVSGTVEIIYDAQSWAVAHLVQVDLRVFDEDGENADPISVTKDAVENQLRASRFHNDMIDALIGDDIDERNAA